jgi:hypothetical protein
MFKASWTYDGTQVNLLKNSDTGDVSNYIENGEWSLEELLVERNIKIYSCCPQPYPNVTYYVVIRRRPLFYVFNMIMPSILITLVGFLIFLIPPDSGEKVGMGVTTLLSMTVFLMVVAENMPPNSDSVPIIAIYYFNSMLMISLATVAAVFTQNVCRKGDEEEPVPEWLKIIFFDILAKILFIKIKANRNLNLSVKEAFPDLKSHEYFKMKPAYHDEPIIYNFNGYLEKTKNNPHLEIWKLNHDSIAKRLSVPSPIIYNRNNLINNDETFKRSTSSQIRNKRYLNANQSKRIIKNKLNSPINSNKNIETTISINSTIFNNHNAKLDSTVRNGASSITNELNLDSINNYNNRKLLKLIKCLNQNLEKSELKELKNDYKSELKSQWKQLAIIIDITLGYLFLFSTIFMLVYLYRSIK